MQNYSKYTEGSQLFFFFFFPPSLTAFESLDYPLENRSPTKSPAYQKAQTIVDGDDNTFWSFSYPGLLLHCFGDCLIYCINIPFLLNLTGSEFQLLPLNSLFS